jgi:hypothetical protein
MVALVDLRGRGAGVEISEQQLVGTASTREYRTTRTHYAPIRFYPGQKWWH